MPTCSAMSWSAGCSRCKTVCVIEVPMIKASMCSDDGHRSYRHPPCILDLTAAGHQPMASADGRYHIVFNGEIYNFMALREELERAGETFTSRADTEVILKMYARLRRGLRAGIQRNVRVRNLG
jgi:Asparagine synthase (glutamine-hydrolyzing)